MHGFPSRYIVLDTETRSATTTRDGWHREQTLRLGWAKVWDFDDQGRQTAHYHGFTSPPEFHGLIRGLPRTDERIVIFAHNAGFDLRIVDWFREVTAGNLLIFPPESVKNRGSFKKPLLLLDGSPIMARFWRPDGQQFLILDSFNWFPMRLGSVAPWTGIDEYPKPKPDAPDDEWWERCRRDVDILDRALRRLWGWLQCLRVTTFEPTPASQSMRVYSQRYERKRIVRDCAPESLELGRLGYYGGLVECYSIGRVDRLTHRIDVTGLYPSVMIGNPYPCELEAHGDARGAPAESVGIDPHRSIAEVWIETRDNPYPIRCKEGTYRAIGKIRTVLAGPELGAAWARGSVVRIGRWCTYRCDHLFDEFVRSFWGLRQKAQARGDEQVAHCCKLILNSLHGKFGQRDGAWEPTGIETRPGRYGSGIVVGPHIRDDVEFKEFNGMEFLRIRDEEHPRAFVPIAAFCAAYARIKMEEYKAIAGADEIHYQAVDCLYLTGLGLGRLQGQGCVDTGQLGHFRHEGALDWIDIYGANSMEWPGGFKHGGIKGTAREIRAGIFEVEEWESLRKSLQSGKVSAVYTATQLKEVSHRYSRRQVGPNGRTVPYQVSTWKYRPETLRDRSIKEVLSHRE